MPQFNGSNKETFCTLANGVPFVNPEDAEESLYHMKRKVFHGAWEKICDSLCDTTVKKIVFQKIILLAFCASILL